MATSCHNDAAAKTFRPFTKKLSGQSGEILPVSSRERVGPQRGGVRQRAISFMARSIPDKVIGTMRSSKISRIILIDWV